MAWPARGSTPSRPRRRQPLPSCRMVARGGKVSERRASRRGLLHYFNKCECARLKSECQRSIVNGARLSSRMVARGGKVSERRASRRGLLHYFNKCECARLKSECQRSIVNGARLSSRQSCGFAQLGNLRRRRRLRSSQLFVNRQRRSVLVIHYRNASRARLRQSVEMQRQSLG